MTKECPHCHIDALRLRDLFGLDYFSPSVCGNCGGLIRNSGWSQFLGPTLTVLWSVIVMSGLGFLPEWLVFSILIFTIPLPWLILAKPVRADTPRIDSPPFTADPHNDKSIIVTGWNEIELHKIIDGFIAQCDSPLRIQAHKRFERELVLTFPEDIPSFDYIALVNYLKYPIDLNTGGQSISVIGKATLTSGFQGIPESLMGKTASFYIPEDDQDFDLVCVATAGHSVLKYSLSEQAWKADR